MNQPKQIALTIDDLPIHGDNTKDYTRLNIAENFTRAFEKFNLPPVTGFANMKAAIETPEGYAVTQHWNHSGNKIANHTFNHLDLEYVSEGEFIEDIEKNEKHLAQLANFERYFRYPFLSESNHFMKRTFVREYLEEKNYKIAPVTMDFYDFMWNTALSKCLTHQHSLGEKYLKNTFIDSAIQCVNQSQLIAKEIFSYDIKHIMLLHMGMATSLFIESLIEKLLSLNYQFITLEEALSDEIYQHNFYHPEQNGLNFLQQAAVAYEFDIRHYPDVPKKQVLRYAYNLPSTITL